MSKWRFEALWIATDLGSAYAGITWRQGPGDMIFVTIFEGILKHLEWESGLWRRVILT